MKRYGIYEAESRILSLEFTADEIDITDNETVLFYKNSGSLTKKGVNETYISGIFNLRIVPGFYLQEIVDTKA